MRKLLIVALFLMIATPTFATIKNQNVNDLLSVELRQARNAAISARDSLNARRAKMLSINTNYGSEIDAADLAKLTSVFNDIVTASEELDDLGINIDTNFPTIKE